MWALVTLILQMIKFFSISLKLFALGFDVLVPGECVVAVTKVTLADFQQFIFPSSLRLTLSSWTHKRRKPGVQMGTIRDRRSGRKTPISS